MRLRSPAVLFVAIASAVVAAQGGAPGPERPRIYGIAHVSFLVSRLPASAEFYEGWLGLAGTQAGACRVYRAGSRQLVMLEPGLAPGQDERLGSIGLVTESPERLKAWLRGKGQEVSEAVRCGRPVLRLTDPEGHSVEFVGPPAARDAAAPAATGGPVGRRILHVGLTVRDLAAMDRLFVGVLGFSEIWRGGRNDEVTDWINMKVPDGTEYIEYMLVGTEPLTRSRLGSMHHVALVVDDMQDAYEAVLARVPRTRWTEVGSPRVGRNRRWQLNLFDPDGTRTELMELHPMR